MSNEPTPDAPAKPKPVGQALSPKEIAELLIKHNGLHHGIYDLQIEFQVGTGAVGPDPQHLSPGMMFGVSKIGLVESLNPGSLSIDASVSNPEPLAPVTDKVRKPRSTRQA